ncbi:MAG: RimK family protein [Rhodospirillales bacterium]|nr:RimK family protein [Rhodospirillales bacterium]MCB9996798.1 RimK family protein [Rhodospirillales bacterium]
MSGVKYLFVTDKGNGNIPAHPDRVSISANDFIANRLPVMTPAEARRVKVINMCSNYGYLSKGYYCSLLAEARGMRCIPSVAQMIQLHWKRNYQTALPELNELLAKHFKEPAEEPLERTYYSYFGRCQNDRLEAVARRAFDLFRFPLMAISLIYADGQWEIEEIDYLSPEDIPAEKQDFLNEALEKFTGAAWSKPNTPKRERYWIGILHDPEEALPPSDKDALQKFIKAGKDMNISVELITKNDYATILEFDALFIRETTAINHHTFRFANKAEREGIPCIDDTESMIRCCNKVFLFELLRANKVPVPQTVILDRKSEKTIEQSMSYPVVLKIPDGSFSRGIIKADTPEAFEKAARELLKKSEIIIAQEFMPSTYDWRIGVLGGKALFACQYFMAEGHWQIYKHPDQEESADKNAPLPVEGGEHLTLPLDDVPDDVLKVALKAARLIGNGLYGVDLKQTENGVYVIEVNDNPNIDVGVEDQVAGDALYKSVLEHLVGLIEAV